MISQRILCALQCNHIFSIFVDVDQHSNATVTFNEETQNCYKEFQWRFAFVESLNDEDFVFDATEKVQ